MSGQMSDEEVEQRRELRRKKVDEYARGIFAVGGYGGTLAVDAGDWIALRARLAAAERERDTLAEHARACLESDAVARELADARRLHETERRYLQGLYEEAQGRAAAAERELAVLRGVARLADELWHQQPRPTRTVARLGHALKELDALWPGWRE